MFSLFRTTETIKIGFEDVKKAISRNYILLNVLPNNMQSILIKGTLTIDSEEPVINEMINNYNVPDVPVIIYGTNGGDAKIQEKCQQLRGLGLSDVYVYSGGLFEWLLLNELYGDEEFPLEKSDDKIIDILKYRQLSILS